MECPKCGTEIGDDLTVCNQCNHSFKKKNTAPKTYWLATLSVCCFLTALAVFIAVIVASVLRIEANKTVADIITIFIIGLLVVSPLLGIAALIRIYQSNNSLKGIVSARTVVVISSFFLLIAAPSSMMFSIIQATK